MKQALSTKRENFTEPLFYEVILISRDFMEVFNQVCDIIVGWQLVFKNLVTHGKQKLVASGLHETGIKLKFLCSVNQKV